MLDDEQVFKLLQPIVNIYYVIELEHVFSSNTSECRHFNYRIHSALAESKRNRSMSSESHSLDENQGRLQIQHFSISSLFAVL